MQPLALYDASGTALSVSMRTSAVVAVLLASTALMAVVRLHTYDEPLETDAATYAVIARELRHGRWLYTDMWDHKPPAVHTTFAAAQIVAGDGAAHIYALGLFAAVVTMLGVYAAGAAVAGRGVGVIAASFWAIVSADLCMQANQPNTEVFINGALIWAFALLLGLPAQRLGVRRLLLVGALLALASLYKHVALVIGAAILLGRVPFVPPGVGARRRAIAQGAIVGAVVVSAWGMVVLYFAATGRFDDFWSTVIEFNRTYAGGLRANLAEAFVFSQLFAPEFLAVLPLIVLTGAGAYCGFSRARPFWAMIGAYAIGTMLAVALPGRFAPHYYQLWLPLLAVGGACGIAAVRPRGSPQRQWLMSRGAVVAAALLAVQLRSLAEPAQEWSRYKYGDRMLRHQRLANAIDEVLLPAETFFQWGKAPELYFYAGRRPPVGEFMSDNLLVVAATTPRVLRVLDTLGRTRPELVAVEFPYPFLSDDPVSRWLLEHYADVNPTAPVGQATDTFRVLARRGGALERRLRDDLPVSTAQTP
jgi:4-amino-4-deoxy-L-arabinose transferase-like glycosyltransferase